MRDLTSDLPSLDGKRWCYWVDEVQDPTIHGGYVPSVVVADEPGHYLLDGDPADHRAAYVWGATAAEAKEIAMAANLERGISEREASDIVMSSMFPRASTG